MGAAQSFLRDAHRDNPLAPRRLVLGERVRGRRLLIASLVSAVMFMLAPSRWLANAWASNSILLVPLATAVIESYVHLRRY
jgi:hypothetical protein